MEVEVVVTLERLWERLGQMRSLSFVARSEQPNGWNGKGRGTVVVECPGERTLLFTESGSWQPQGGRDLRFRNVFRWSVVADSLRLEHLRFGVDHPVYLFDLVPAGEREWRSVSPHLCSEDCYSAVLLLEDEGVVLRWSVEGPRKREMIECLYSTQDDSRALGATP